MGLIRKIAKQAALAAVTSVCGYAYAAETAVDPALGRWGFLSAAIVMGLSAVGAGIAAKLLVEELA